MEKTYTAEALMNQTQGKPTSKTWWRPPLLLLLPSKPAFRDILPLNLATAHSHLDLCYSMSRDAWLKANVPFHPPGLQYGVCLFLRHRKFTWQCVYQLDSKTSFLSADPIESM